MARSVGNSGPRLKREPVGGEAELAGICPEAGRLTQASRGVPSGEGGWGAAESGRGSDGGHLDQVSSRGPEAMRDAGQAGPTGCVGARGAGMGGAGMGALAGVGQFLARWV